jgi:hypothetical protein
VIHLGKAFGSGSTAFEESKAALRLLLLAVTWERPVNKVYSKPKITTKNIPRMYSNLIAVECLLHLVPPVREDLTVRVVDAMSGGLSHGAACPFVSSAAYGSLVKRENEENLLDYFD